MTICFQPHLTFYLGMCNLLGFTHFILLYDTWVVPLYLTWKLISWENSYLVEQAPTSASRSYSWTKPKWNCCIYYIFWVQRTECTYHIMPITQTQRTPSDLVAMSFRESSILTEHTQLTLWYSWNTMAELPLSYQRETECTSSPITCSLSSS